MTIQQSHPDSLGFLTLKKSHRTKPEQFVGLAIYLSLCVAFQLISRLSIGILGAVYFCSIALGMWSIWRRYSLRVLKLELSLFLSQGFFQICWSVSFFALKEPLLALVMLLLLWCNTLVATLLYWKKEPFAGVLYLFPLIWIFYLAGMNMVMCISNP